MNIYEITGNAHAKQPSIDRKVKGDNGFGQILNNATNSIVNKGSAIDEAPPLRGVDPPALWDSRQIDQPVLERASNILNLLEEYSQALNNPKTTLKGIEPVVTRIEEELKALGLHGGNTWQHQELAGIINDIAVTAKVEAFKFYRGDYVVS